MGGVQRRRRTLRSVVLLLAVAVSPAPSSARQAEALPHEIKAAFLAKFLDYTEWPASSFTSARSPLRVLVVGAPEVAEALRGVAERSASRDGRQLEIVERSAPAAAPRAGDALVALARGCHAIYVGDVERDHAERLLALLERTVLTVGDQPGFAERGGMIGLREEGRRIVFEANPRVIRDSDLAVSARVLQLARIVGPGRTS